MVFSQVTFEFFFNHIRADLELLNQLHILSQTESLSLESGDFSDLQNIVRKKENLLLELGHRQNNFNEVLRCEPRMFSEMMAQKRDVLDPMKQEGFRLLEQITQIDARNRVQLEKMRSQAIESSRQMCQDLNLRKTYQSSRHETVRVSEQTG